MDIGKIHYKLLPDRMYVGFTKHHIHYICVHCVLVPLHYEKCYLPNVQYFVWIFTQIHVVHSSYIGVCVEWCSYTLLKLLVLAFEWGENMLSKGFYFPFQTKIFWRGADNGQNLCGKQQSDWPWNQLSSLCDLASQRHSEQHWHHCAGDRADWHQWPATSYQQRLLWRVCQRGRWRTKAYNTGGHISCQNHATISIVRLSK